VTDNGSTRFIVVSVNGAPVISFPRSAGVDCEHEPIRPFQLVQVQDDDSNVVVNVSLNASAGALTNLGGFVRTNNSPSPTG